MIFPEDASPREDRFGRWFEKPFVAVVVFFGVVAITLPVYRRYQAPLTKEEVEALSENSDLSQGLRLSWAATSRSISSLEARTQWLLFLFEKAERSGVEPQELARALGIARELSLRFQQSHFLARTYFVAAWTSPDPERALQWLDWLDQFHSVRKQDGENDYWFHFLGGRAKLLRARLLAEPQKVSEAVSQLTRAVELRPTSLSARLWLAVAQKSDGNRDASRKAFESLLRLEKANESPKAAEKIRNLARLCLERESTCPLR